MCGARGLGFGCECLFVREWMLSVKGLSSCFVVSWVHGFESRVAGLRFWRLGIATAIATWILSTDCDSAWRRA